MSVRGRFPMLLAGLGLAWCTSLAAAGDEAAGKRELLANECNKCHSLERFAIEATVKSEKMKGPDLGTVGSKHDPEWMAQFVTKQIEKDGKTHKGKFEGTEKQLQAIVDWLETLKED